MRKPLFFVLGVALVACSSSNGDSGAASDATNDGDASTQLDSIGDDVSEAGDDVSLDEDATPAGALDCTWANDPKNCWRTFVKGVDDCLGNVAGSSEVGAMSADGKSCSYATGRSVAFTIPFDALDAQADRNFTIASGASTCLRYVEHASSTGFVVTSPAGTLTYSAVGNDVTIKCPDGSSVEGDAKKIALGCGEAILNGGVPGNDVESAPARFKLSGSRNWDFECASAGGDAGVDGDGD